MNNIVLLDSDYLFALFVESDANNKKAIKLSEIIESRNLKVVVTNLVKLEVATLFSRRVSQHSAVEVIKILNSFENIFVDQKQTEEIWEVFHSYTKSRISFVDCSNLYLAKKYKARIASFDKFYTKDFLLGAIGD